MVGGPGFERGTGIPDRYGIEADRPGPTEDPRPDGRPSYRG